MNYKTIAMQQAGRTALIIGDDDQLRRELDSRAVYHEALSPDAALRRPDNKYHTVYVMDPDAARWPREILELAARQARARVVVVSSTDNARPKRMDTTQMYETMRDYGHAGNISYLGDGWQAFTFEVPYA